MDPIAFFLLLYAATQGRGSGGGGSTFAFPKVPPAPPVDAPIPASVPSGPTFGKQWLLYQPLNQAVINRAVALLRDPTAKTETIEPDPSGKPGQVRYLKLEAPKGKLTVTAWRPNPNFGAATPATAPGASPDLRLVRA